MDARNLIEDEFTTSITLQKWIGISYTVSDNEIRPLLQQAIHKELQIGLSILPHHVYYSHFNTTYEQLIKHSSTNQLRIWLQQVQYGRHKFDKDNILQDDFYHTGLLRQWLGLPLLK